MTGFRRAVMLTGAVLLFASGVPVHAESIAIAIADLDSLRTVGTVPGATLTLFGSVTNTSDSVLWLNNAGGRVNDNVPADSNIVLDATYQIGSAGNTYTLQPGEMTGRIPFVTLFINPSAPDPSLTSGSVDVCGGASASACTPLGRAFYSVRVSTAAPVPTPEPTAMLLFGTGLVGLIMTVRRKTAAARN